MLDSLQNQKKLFIFLQSENLNKVDFQIKKNNFNCILKQRPKNQYTSAKKKSTEGNLNPTGVEETRQIKNCKKHQEQYVMKQKKKI